MNCPSCGAPMHQVGDSLKCDYCKTVVVPDRDSSGVRVLDEVADQLCPVCNIALHNAALGKSPLLYCTQCHGMLIAMMEFESLVDAARTASAPIPALPADIHELDRRIDCPQCHKTMDVHWYAGEGHVVMDTCETCCLHWLDHDELARIAQANPDQPNAIDSSPDSFYDPTDDRQDQDFAAQSDPAAEAVDLLTRLLKPRI